MPQERNDFKLGLTLIVFVLMFVVVLVFLAPRGGGNLSLVVRYPHGAFYTALNPGSEVDCGGKAVGSVRSVDLQEMDSRPGGPKSLYVLITIAVDSSLNLRRDCVIVPEELLLGGPGKLAIADRGVGDPVRSGDIVEGKPGASLTTLSRMLATQLDPHDPASLLSMLRTQLDPADARSLAKKLHTSLDDLNVATAGLREELDPTQAAALLTRLHAVVDGANEAVRLLRSELDRQTDQALVSRMHQSLDALNAGLAAMTAILKENRSPSPPPSPTSATPAKSSNSKSPPASPASSTPTTPPA